MKKLPKSTPRRGKLGWKKYQKTGGIKKNLGLGLGVLAVLLILLLLSKIFGFIQDFNQPFRPDGGKLTKNYSWDGKSNLNIVVRAEKIYLLSFNYPEKKLTVLNIPDETYLNLPFGFGRWGIRSIYGLGQSENPPTGAKLLKDSLTLNFGLPIHGYFLLPEEKEQFLLSYLEEGRGNPLVVWQFLQKIKTDLTLGELLQVVMALKDIRQDKLETIDLADSSLTDWVNLADGSKVLGISQMKVDKFVQSELIDPQIREEGFTVGIFNTTEYPGLGERAARLIANMGGRVIFTTNSPELFKQSVVLGKGSYTLGQARENFAPNCRSESTCLKIACQNSGLEGKSCQLKNLKLELTRADINIFLGEDYFLRYNKKP